ncbi:hypothetical protein TNCV_655551 [Trichonephila clavipes]|nr:hypothetical protein TNCV_655551 [Trichonephila clavipes]
MSVENSDQLLIKYPSSTEEGLWPTEIVDYLSGEIGSRVRRNQTTVTWICDRRMQEGTMDRRGRSHPPQCTIFTSLPCRVRMAVTGSLSHITNRSTAH